MNVSFTTVFSFSISPSEQSRMATVTKTARSKLSLWIYWHFTYETVSTCSFRFGSAVHMVCCLFGNSLTLIWLIACWFCCQTYILYIILYYMSYYIFFNYRHCYSLWNCQHNISSLVHRCVKQFNELRKLEIFPTAESYPRFILFTGALNTVSIGMRQ